MWAGGRQAGYFSLFNSNPDHCGWLAGNLDLEVLKLLFENKESQENGETTVLQAFTHPSQQKIFELLGTRKLCTLFHIFTHTPVGIQTVYVKLEFLLCPYRNVTLNSVGVTN
jgi:hypothetical protein